MNNQSKRREPYRLTPYQRIIRAREAGRGVRFNADETHQLSFDGAIEAVAAGDDERQCEITKRHRWDEGYCSRCGAKR